MKNTMIILFLFGLSFSMMAQQIKLEDKLQGNKNLEEIMAVVNLHYAAIESGAVTRTNEPKYKHWVRWAHYMSSRTDTDGNLVNVGQRIGAALKTAHRHQDARVSTGSWVSIGPNKINVDGSPKSAIGIGRVDRIAFHPTNANIMYIGTPAGGLFKTTNAGSSWSPVSSGLPSTGIAGIVVSHDNPDKIFILTGDGDSNIGGFVQSFGYLRWSAGAFVSYDGGSNWFALGNLPISGNYAGYQLVQDPNNANILMAATSKGVYRSTDSGASWTQSTSSKTYELKYKPGSSTVVYATQSAVFKRSTNGGVTFSTVSISPALPNNRVALAVTEGNANMVYIMSGSGSTGSTFGGIYRSTNSGANFTQMSNSPNIVTSECDGTGGGNNQSFYDLALGVSHTNTDYLITGAVRCWGSANGGVSLVNLTPACGNSSSSGTNHADIHDIEYSPVTGEVFVCSDGGLIKSASGGAAWTSLSDGISASQIYHMAGSNVSIDNMLIGLQDNGTRSRDDNSSTWNYRTGADGFDCIYDNNSATEGYIVLNKDFYSFTGNGGSINLITPLAPASTQWFGRVTRANNDSDVVLAGYTDIYRSINGGSTWSNRGARGNWDLEHCPSDNTRFYAAGGNASTSSVGRGIYRSDDIGWTWTAMSSTNLPPSASNLKVTDIGVRSNQSSHVWLTFGGFGEGQKVYRSTNAGASWVNMSGSLPNVPINCIVVDASNNVYIGTDIGVYYRANTMSDWVPFWKYLPVVPVTDLELYEGNSLIRAATFGKGVYQSNTYSTCVAAHTLNYNLSGNLIFEASNTISTNGDIIGGANSHVILKAGNSVTMTPGFLAQRHTRFRAYVKPCGQYELD